MTRLSAADSFCVSSTWSARRKMFKTRVMLKPSFFESPSVRMSMSRHRLPSSVPCIVSAVPADEAPAVPDLE